MRKLIPVLLSVLFLMVSCNKQDSFIYSGIEAGTITSGVFTSDNGTRMTVVGNEGKFDVSTSRRVLISYETRPITDPTQISIDLLGLLDASILQPSHEEILPVDPSGSPLDVTDAWFSREYLNILATFEGKDADKHTFTADYTASEKGLSFRLYHDGTQDSAAGDSHLNVFLCIPMDEPVQSYAPYAQDAGTIQILLQWTTRTSDGSSLTLHEKKGSYQPSADN